MYAARQIRAKRCFFRSSDHGIALWRHFPCTLQQCTGREVDVLTDGGCCCIPGGVGAGEGGAGAPYAFQRLRLGGMALDGELARLVPRAVLTSARTDAVIPLRARAFPPAPLSLKAKCGCLAKTTLRRHNVPEPGRCAIMRAEDYRAMGRNMGRFLCTLLQ